MTISPLIAAPLILVVLAIDVILVWLAVRWWKARPLRKTKWNPACAKCLATDLVTEASHISNGVWLCSAHFDEILRDEQKMREEARDQNRDAMLDGGKWSKRLQERRQLLRGPNFDTRK